MNKYNAIICDLDGTACLFNGRGPYDEQKCDTDLPNAPVITVLRAFYDLDYDIIFTSGRSEDAREKSIAWLDQHFGRQYVLYMRQLSERGIKDSIVKERIYRDCIEPFFNVLFVMDDRNQVVDLWRSLGLTCFQVAPGNF